ncbi:uncharacterized protein RJT21DRAFT_127415 [Scheffersomyces amazonensis]|uniref:uncharacterized protein n=1 Tax=Scheffersomyces amazonensis TaxID=1078765 RepID=UPI00315D51D8
MSLELLNEKLELAILYFKTAEYNKALKLYDVLVKLLTNLSISTIKKARKEKGIVEVPVIGVCVHPSLVSVLDQRAATHEKLNSLSKALLDAQQITRIDPISCKGYLRIGKILRRMGRDIDAYKSYQEGIYIIDRSIKQHNIIVPEKLLLQLKSQYKDLNQKLRTASQRDRSSSDENNSSQNRASQKSLDRKLNQLLPLKRSSEDSVSGRTKRIQKSGVDPFLYLSQDLIELIFSQFPLNSLLKCHKVCKLWYNVLTNIPALYNNKFILKPKITNSEFSSGIKLIKKIVHKSYSKQVKVLRVRSTVNSAHLSKVIDLIIQEPNFSIQNLEIFDNNLSFQLILSRLSKFSWKLNNLNNLQELRLGIVGSIRNENLLIQLFPKLKHLSMIVTVPELSGSSNDLLPVTDKRYQKLIEISLVSTSSLVFLETLALVNHPQLLRSNSRVAAGNNTFNPYPIFLDKTFPNLKELSIASYEFYNTLPMLGEFLTNSPNLTKLIMENNVNFKLLDFLQLLKNYNPKLKLNKLIFREEKLNSATSLNEFDITDLPQLSSLEHLDLYGSSLSNKGLLKLLRMCNMNGQLNTIVIGPAGYIHFKTDTFPVGSGLILSLKQLIRVAPNLERLYLNELDLDNSTLKDFSRDLRDMNFKKSNLKLLDLSFCVKVEGIGLIDLFDASSTNLKRIAKGDNFDRLSIDELVIDGVEINSQTLKMLKDFKYVKEIRNDINKRKWKVFGVNSLIVSN